MRVRKADDDALMNAETVTLCQRLPRGEMDERPCRKTSDARGFGPGREARGLNEIIIMRKLNSLLGEVIALIYVHTFIYSYIT